MRYLFWKEPISGLQTENGASVCNAQRVRSVPVVRVGFTLWHAKEIITLQGSCYKVQIQKCFLTRNHNDLEKST